MYRFLYGSFRTAICAVAFLLLLPAMAEETHINSDSRIKIPIGVYVTSLYNLDIPNKSFTIKAWIWSTYDPKKMPNSFKFYNKIEFTNARDWHIIESENFTIDNLDGTRHTMTKFTANINQDWDIRHFPFDQQTMMLKIESIELDSYAIQYVPDMKNSLISDDLVLSGWDISPIQIRSFDYKYPTTFGLQNGTRGIYPRMTVTIPITRDGTRIFWTYFLGFFVAYVIISILPFFNRTMIDSRVGLIMSALFACVGNKYTIDLLLPSNAVFTLSDLIQVATFIIVGLGLLSSVMIVLLSKKGKQELAYRIDTCMNIGIIFGYPMVIYIGVMQTSEWIS